MSPVHKTPTAKALAFRDEVRAWLRSIEQRHQITLPAIAKRADIRHSTLYRWFDDEQYFIPSYAKIRAIADAFGEPMPGEAQPQAPVLQEGDTSPYVGPPLFDQSLTNNQVDKVVACRSLELIGYMPGDIIRMDAAIAPREGDAVVAQVYDRGLGYAVTRLRQWESPHLVTRTMDPANARQRLLVDGVNVAIVGTVVRSLRIRAP